MNNFRDYDYFETHYKKYQPSKENEKKHRRGLWDLFGRYVPVDKGINILDIGCGAGQWLLTLAEREYVSIEGIEVSPQQSQQCWNRGLNVHLVDNTVEFLDNHPKKYSLITMFDVLEHISKDDQIQLLSKIRSALTENGTFICTVPNANSIVASRWRYIDWTHITSFTEDSLQFVLFAAGFSNVEVTCLHIAPRMPWLVRPSVIDYYIRRLLRGFYRCLLYAEIGKQAWHIPLSYNLVGIGIS